MDSMTQAAELIASMKHAARLRVVRDGYARAIADAVIDGRDPNGQDVADYLDAKQQLADNPAVTA